MTKGFTDLRNKLAILRETSPTAARLIAIEFGGECVQVGKTSGIIPKISGNLRSTARVETEGKAVYFVTGGVYGNPTRANQTSKFVDYAIYVNNGTSRFDGQFFMERIVNRVALNKEAVFSRAINSWLKAI